MRTGNISSVIFSLLREAGPAETIQLTPGQIISVLLKEVRGNLALLSYQGKELLARLEADIPAGMRLSCLVEGEKDGTIILKMLPDSRNSFSGEALKSIITGLGLSDAEPNRLLVSEMIKQELPLTSEAARLLSAFGRSVNISPQEAWIPVFMHKLGFPLTQQMYQGVREILTNLNYLQPEVEQLIEQLRSLVVGTKPGSELNRQAATVLEALGNMRITLSDTQGAITNKLLAVFQMLSSTPGGTPSQPGMVPGGTGTGVPVHSMAYTETGKASGQGGSQTGSAPGSPAQGSPAQGNAAQGNAAQGSATQGSATQGSATQGSPAQVSAVQGSAAQGSTAQPNPAGGAQLNYPGGAGSQTYGSMPGGTGDTGLSGPQGGFVRSPAGIPDIAVSMGSTFNTSGSADGSSNVGTAGNTGNASTTGNAGNVHNAARGTGELIESILTRLGELQARGPAPEDSTAREAMLSRVHSVLKEAAEVSGKLNLPASLERLSGLLDESGRQEFTDLARLAKSVAGKLEVIQNFNTRADMNLDNPTIVYSSIRFENREEPLRLLVNYRFQNRSRKRDFKTCQVEVRLETPGLGPVSCHITVNDRNLDVQFTVDNEMSAGIIDKFGGVLVRRLEEMEYRVRMPACRVEQGGSSGGIGGELQEVTGLFRIDLQV